MLYDHLNMPFVDLLVYDWMHIYFVDGIYCKELAALLELLEPHGFGAAALHGYMQMWVWPECTHHSKDLCKTRGNKHTPNGSASEYLSTAQILRKWLIDVVAPCGLHPAAVRSMIALLDVVDVLMQAQSGALRPRTLEDLILAHLRLHLDAYGAHTWKPKFNCALHLATMLETTRDLAIVFRLGA